MDNIYNKNKSVQNWQYNNSWEGKPHYPSNDIFLGDEVDLENQIFIEDQSEQTIEHSANILQGVVNGLFLKAHHLNAQVQIHFPTQDTWTQLQITAAELLNCIQRLQKNQKSHKYEDAEHHLFFYKTETQKIKILILNDKHIAKGGSSYVYAGYKLNGKSEFLKKKIVKSPRINKTQREQIKSTILDKQKNKNTLNFSEVEKKSHLQFYKLLSQDFIEEKKGIDLLHVNKKTVIGIQDQFDCFHFDGKTYLVTKQYDQDLEKAVSLSLAKKVNASKQIAMGIKEIISKSLAVLDTKVENIVYSEIENEIEVVHIDLNPYNKEQIKKEIKEKNLCSRDPIKIYTPEYLHMSDLKKLQEIVINYEKTGQETLLDDYMNVSHKIMIAQLAHVFFALFTKSVIAKKSEIAEDDDLNSRALNLKNQTIKRRLNHIFAKKIEESKSSQTALEQLRDLTLAMFNVNAEERPSIDFILDCLNQIKVGKRAVTEDGNNILSSKRKKEDALEGN